LVVVALEQREPGLMVLAEHLAAILFLAPLLPLAGVVAVRLLVQRQMKLD
jgi:hypothetical protein